MNTKCHTFKTFSQAPVHPLYGEMTADASKFYEWKAFGCTWDIIEPAWASRCTTRLNSWSQHWMQGGPNLIRCVRNTGSVTHQRYLTILTSLAPIICAWETPQEKFRSLWAWSIWSWAVLSRLELLQVKREQAERRTRILQSMSKSFSSTK